MDNKILASYLITRFENGDISIENNEIEGVEKLSNEELFRDVEAVAEMINLKKIENASYSGIKRFYVEAAQQRKEANSAQPTIE